MVQLDFLIVFKIMLIINLFTQIKTTFHETRKVFRNHTRLKTTDMYCIETPAPPRQCLLGKAKIKSVKLTGILTFGFVLCWTPYQIANVW